MRILSIAFALTFAAAAPAFAAMSLTSRDLTPGAAMPTAHIYPRCGGQNVSPQLSWTAPPAAAKSLVLTMIDQDVKPHLWSHWIVVGLPPAAGALERGARALPSGSRGVSSNFGDPTYDGPCPPAGSGVHRYRFTIWAMPTTSVAIAGDEKADAVQARLARTALDHGDLTVSVAAK